MEICGPRTATHDKGPSQVGLVRSRHGAGGFVFCGVTRLLGDDITTIKYNVQVKSYLHDISFPYNTVIICIVLSNQYLIALGTAKAHAQNAQKTKANINKLGPLWPTSNHVRLKERYHRRGRKKSIATSPSSDFNQSNTSSSILHTMALLKCMFLLHGGCIILGRINLEGDAIRAPFVATVAAVVPVFHDGLAAFAAFE